MGVGYYPTLVVVHLFFVVGALCRGARFDDRSHPKRLPGDRPDGTEDRGRTGGGGLRQPGLLLPIPMATVLSAMFSITASVTVF